MALQNRRREQARTAIDVTSVNELQSIENDVNKEELRREKKLDKQLELESSASYVLIKSISKVMDDYCLDGIIGFIPFVGDIITLVTGAPFLYIALLKIRSLPLTLAVISNLLLDALVGMIPMWIGNICDFLFKGNKRNYKLIVGFVEDDQEIVKQVNRRALVSLIFIGILIFLIYLLVGLIADFTSFIGSFF
ncbi:MAG: DUF4112 domain-containing protein [Phocaeicola sp.]